MSIYLLDTNVASHVIRGDRPEINRKLVSLPLSAIAISAISKGELLYGLARRGRPPKLSRLIDEFLIRVDVLAWDQDVAETYGELRAVIEEKGFSLSAADMMIAAHAVASDATLVTRDKAFMQISDLLRVEDWILPALA